MEIPWFHIMVYAQVLVWFIVWELNLTWVSSRTLLISAPFVAYLVWARDFGVGFYTPLVLLQYILMVSAVTLIGRYVGLKDPKPVCLAMLLVFLNSFYWEAPLHFLSLFEGGFGVFLVQSLHLIPIALLWRIGFRLRERWWYSSLKVWFLVLGLFFIRSALGGPWTPWTLFISRVAGLYGMLSILKLPSDFINSSILKTAVEDDPIDT